MLARSDLRLAPAAAALWALAGVGVHGGGPMLLAALATAVAIVLLVAVLTRGGGMARTLGAHLGLVLIGCVLLVPAALRHETAVTTLEDAATQRLVLEVDVEILGEPEVPDSGPAWARGGRQVLGRTVPGPARIGRSASTVGEVRVLIRAEGPVAEEVGGLRSGDRVQLRGTVRTAGDLVVLVPSRVGTAGAEQGPRIVLRDRAREATARLPADEAALIRGMTTGDTQGLSTRAEEAMRRAGISHLVAVSGANIALVLAAVLVPLLLIGVRRRARIVLAATVCGGYVLLVGPEPSVLRAVTMAAPLLLARFIGVRASPVAALALTVALWASLDPVTASSAGFVLSALATAAILILAPPLARALSSMSRGRLGERAALVLAVPLVAQAACTPVLVLLTPEVSVWAVAVNMAVAPIVAPATVLGMVALLLAVISPALAGPVYDVAAGGAHLVLLTALTADALPGARIPVPEGAAGALGAIVLLTLGAAALAARRRRMVRFAAVAVLVAVLAPPVAMRLPGGRDQDWIVAACAVGQGDAVLLRPAEATATILIDTGPDPRALTACLDLLGVRRIDLLVLTHPHADHVGGTAALTGTRAPARQWTCPLEEALIGTSDAVAAEPVTIGAAWSSPGLDLEVLWPPDAATARSAAAREDGGGEGDAANDCSVVIAATWADGTRYLGLGDLEPVAQQMFAARDPAEVDVVKIAHHGSARQHAPLYEQLSPQVVLVTAGQENSFGHPTRRALEIARGQTSHVGRTDVHGTVLVLPGDITALRSVGAAR